MIATVLLIIEATWVRITWMPRVFQSKILEFGKRNKEGQTNNRIVHIVRSCFSRQNQFYSIGPARSRHELGEVTVLLQVHQGFEGHVDAFLSVLHRR